ncbi:hypothetical protein [Amycolatopsis sp. CA-230715]|uniref:hypothetical protein n=1 Tax=Amycolatopsis sp. CA-230715 TaxID=2745196 RepID=UPI001C00D770|nr:hypothetical protein [Amycolatopsis sp. CA-230715]QWF81869.1 hypothetical protein HUW46_05302 [Amycolatopsis sp. CA-230715]
MNVPPNLLADIAGGLADYPDDGLMLGFPAAPFVLVLRPDEPQSLRYYVDRNGENIDVRIEFANRGVAAGDWVIVPADGSDDFRLRFALPALLEDWLLSDDGAAAIRARDAQATLLSSISVFLDHRLVRLFFTPRHRPEAETGPQL